MNKFGKFLAGALCVATLTSGTAGALVGCGNGEQNADYPTGELVIIGSSSVEAILGEKKLAGQFMEKYPGTKISVGTQGSGTGIKETSDGNCQIGTSSRALTADEATKLDSKNLCIDGIVFVVSANCGITQVTNEEIYELYVNNTPIVQGSNTINAAVTREGTSGTREAFEEKIKAADGTTIKSGKSKFSGTQYKTAAEQTSTGTVISKINSDTNNRSIGYISYGSYLQNKDKVKALKFKAKDKTEYVEATQTTIKNGSYELQRPFVILTKKGATLTPLAKFFYDWLFKAETQADIEKEGYVLIS